jgi:hypothetical protein
VPPSTVRACAQRGVRVRQGDDKDTHSSRSTSMKAMHRLWLTVRFMWLGE